MVPKTDAWKRTISQIAETIDPHRFETWFKPLVLADQPEDDVLVLSAPNQFIRDFLDQHYKANILSIIRTHSETIQSVSFDVSSQQSPAAAPPTLPAFPEKPVPTPFPSQKHILNKRFTFESFVVGPGNEFAKSAAFAVAEAPGKTKFNPLLVYGGVGLGKTHLLQAIGNYQVFLELPFKVTYITSEEFYLSFIDSIKNNNTRVFTEQFRASDILLMDDIQFFSGKESTQEEFFFIFNTLYQNGKQIVLTSDVPPTALKGLQERLISRFQWGLSVDIQPPNLETRVAILKKKAEEDNLNLPQNVLYYIAENISSNIRELEGVVIRLLAHASITKSDIDIDLVKNVIKFSSGRQKSRISIDQIVETAASYYKIPVNNIREKNRRKEVAHARQVAMYIAKSITDYSLKTIGLNLGGRDHSTVIHAVSQIEELKKNDMGLVRDINQIIAILEQQ